MSGLYLCKHRTDRLTFLHAVLTAILERAAMRNIQRAWSLTFNTLDLFCSDPYEWKTERQEEPVYMDEEIFLQHPLLELPPRYFQDTLPRSDEQKERISARSWQIKSMLMFFSFWRRTSSWITDSCTETSSAEVASSHTRISGSRESARAILIRCL